MRSGLRCLILLVASPCTLPYHTTTPRPVHLPRSGQAQMRWSQTTAEESAPGFIRATYREPSRRRARAPWKAFVRPRPSPPPAPAPRPSAPQPLPAGWAWCLILRRPAILCEPRQQGHVGTAAGRDADEAAVPAAGSAALHPAIAATRHALGLRIRGVRLGLRRAATHARGLPCRRRGRTADDVRRCGGGARQMARRERAAGTDQARAGAEQRRRGRPR